jgi:TolB-like protein/lipoprotein NlpI
MTAAHPVGGKSDRWGQRMSGETPESGEGPAPTDPPTTAQAPPSGTDDAAPHASAHVHAHQPTIQFRFFDQLKQRNIIRVAILYLVACWLILDPVHVVFHMLEVPAWANRLVVILIVIGFPMVLLFAWVYEITPEGLKPTVEVEPHRSIRKQTGQRLNRAIVVVLALAVAYLLTDKFWLSKHVASAEHEATPSSLPKAPAMAVIAERSIAVLPFINMSPDKDQEYFADGLAEELLELLARTPGLHVIARTSSFSFKGKSDDIPTIASKLKVTNILEGSVRKSGNRLRVTTQLVRAADGEHLWSETYDRAMRDIFKVQDEIAAAVVAALKLKLAPGQNSSPRRSTNPDAYFQYLLGEQFFSRGSDEDYRRSVAAYRQAIALDPNYAAAYAGLANSEYYLSDVTGDAAGLDRAMSAAERAVTLAPDQPMGYAARGELRSSIAWDWSGAQSDFARALELDPGDPFVLRHYSLLLQSLGRLPEAITAARKVTEIDPFSAPARRSLSEALFYNGELPAAREAIHRSLAIEPKDRYAIRDLGEFELLDHRSAEALGAFQEIDPDDLNSVGFRATGIAMAEHSLGHARESQQALDEAIAKAAQNSAYQIAEAYAWRGEKDKALEWLERAHRQRDGGLTHLKTDPVFAALRSDPRFKAMLRKINFPE